MNIDTTPNNNNGKATTMNFSIGNITINGSMFDIHDNHNVHINGASQTPSKETTPTAERIKAAILQLMDMKDEGGKYLFSQKSHWFVVYKVLSEYYQFPENMKEFEKLMIDWGMLEARVPVDYESFRKETAKLRIATKKHADWHKIVAPDTKTKLCIDLSTALLELLKS
ncbi:MAG: hypothetical protein J6R79_06715 [Bacteroidaceae bacterium]|nr:hypothetical protein [Bacteroidaceae bacterium]